MPSPTVSLTDPSPTEPFTSNPYLTDLVITDLTKSYAGRTVLAGIDLRAGPATGSVWSARTAPASPPCCGLLAGVERAGRRHRSLPRPTRSTCRRSRALAGTRSRRCWRGAGAAARRRTPDVEMLAQHRNRPGSREERTPRCSNGPRRTTRGTPTAAPRRSRRAARARRARPRPPGRHAVRWRAHPAGAGDGDDHPAGVRPARRADQPPRRRRDRRCWRRSCATCPAWSCWPATTGCCSTTCAPTSSTSTRRARHRRAGRAPVRRRLDGYQEQAARPRRRWEETYAAQQEELDRLRDARPGSAPRRSRTTAARGTTTSTSTLQGRQRRPHAGPPEAGRRAATGDRRAHPGPPATGAAGVPGSFHCVSRRSSAHREIPMRIRDL